MGKRYFKEEKTQDGASGYWTAPVKGDAKFVVKDPSIGTQFPEGAYAQVTAPRYEYLPETPDSDGQYKLFNYHQPKIESLYASRGASKSSIAEVLALATQHARKKWGSVTYSDDLTGHSMKTVDQGIRRGDIDPLLDETSGKPIPLSETKAKTEAMEDGEILDDLWRDEGRHNIDDYDQETIDEGRKKVRDYHSSVGNASARGSITELEHSVGRDEELEAISPWRPAHLKTSELPADAGVDAVRQTFKDRELRKLRDPRTTLMQDQLAANAEYDRLKTEHESTPDLFGEKPSYGERI
jgi:hypothetical protein